MDSWKRLACYPRGSFYPLIFGLVLASTIGSLSSAFAPARHVRLAVKPACPFAGPARFPFALSRPLNSSITLWEENAPFKLPTRHCLDPLYPKGISDRLEYRFLQSGISLAAPSHPETGFQSLPPMLRSKNLNPISSYSKAPGVFSSNCR